MNWIRTTDLWCRLDRPFVQETPPLMAITIAPAIILHRGKWRMMTRFAFLQYISFDKYAYLPEQ